MIVKHTNEGWEIIYQYAHGMLAGKIAVQLEHKLRPSHWLDTLVAIINHDDYMLMPSEKSYLDGTGAPLDFILESPSDDDRLAHARQLIHSAREKSPWVAMLISRHQEFLYREAAKDNAAMQQFLDEQVQARQQWRRYYGVRKEVQESAYQFLRFCDRLSLILCRAEVPAMGRQLEINTSINGVQYFIQEHPRHADTYTVTPWCFEQREVRLTIDVQTLTQLTFSNDAALTAALQQAPTQLREWTLRAS